MAQCSVGYVILLKVFGAGLNKGVKVMWKLLSGIALVVVLDLAFIWMVASESEELEIAANVGPRVALPVIHEPFEPPVAVDDSVEPPVTAEVAEFREFRRQLTPNRRTHAATPTVGQTAVTAQPMVQQAKLFEDRVIWIGRIEVPVKIETSEKVPEMQEPQRPQFVQASISEPRIEKRKRSFGSKALGVIKKPYDWMKTVADKLY